MTGAQAADGELGVGIISRSPASPRPSRGRRCRACFGARRPPAKPRPTTTRALQRGLHCKEELDAGREPALVYLAADTAPGAAGHGYSERILRAAAARNPAAPTASTWPAGHACPGGTPDMDRAGEPTIRPLPEPADDAEGRRLSRALPTGLDPAAGNLGSSALRPDSRDTAVSAVGPRRPAASRCWRLRFTSANSR